MSKFLINGGVTLLCFPLLLTVLTAIAKEDVPAQYSESADQYRSWQATSEQSDNQDMLAATPAMVILWAGSSFAKQYNSPRGHHFAVSDAARSLRTGVKLPAGEQGLSASCWSCKTPDAFRLMEELGVEGFSAKNFTDLGTEIKSVVHCTDCHVKGEAKLNLPRPHAQDAMNKVQLPFEQQSINMQGAQVCGQCHVTYYFQPERSNKVNIPWIFGSTADAIEKYYDTRRFYEWNHPISRTPMLKARHPEFEHWSRSTHAQKGVSCISCHMPKTTNEQGVEYTNHKIDKALPNFTQVCSGCHQSQDELTQQLEQAKHTIESKARQVESLLVKAHYEAGAAWDAGASWPIMNSAIMAIRHAQWRWDFAMASHGLYAHNPQEGVALLDKAIEQATYARNSLAEILSMLSVEKVNYPDISSKESAQKAVGIALDKLTKEKQDFIKQEIEQHWDEVANRE